MRAFCNTRSGFHMEKTGKYITVNSYGARWVKNIKDNVMS